MNICSRKSRFSLGMLLHLELPSLHLAPRSRKRGRSKWRRSTWSLLNSRLAGSVISEMGGVEVQYDQLSALDELRLGYCQCWTGQRCIPSEPPHPKEHIGAYSRVGRSQKARQGFFCPIPALNTALGSSDSLSSRVKLLLIFTFTHSPVDQLTSINTSDPK